jgi:hypothetical protein
MVIGSVAGAAVAAIVAPRLHARREAEFLRIEVSATHRAGAGSPVVLHVRARNTHPSRRRIYASWLDVSESLGRAGDVTGTDGNERARWVPLARVWRVPFVEEISAGETRDFAVRIMNAKPGRYDGTGDVVLNGTSWVRDQVEFEVAGAGLQSGSDEIR